MATQTFVTDMQAINPTSVQQVQQASSQPAQQSQQSSQPPTQTVAIQKVVTNQATILQPAQTHSGQQFIVTISGDHNSEQQNQETVQLQQVQQGSGQATVYPAHVQYVDGSPDSAIYPASNGHMQAYTEYTQPTAMYTPVSGTYYQASPSGGQMAGIAQVGTVQHQILTQQGGTYLVQGGAMDGEGHPLTHTTRASPATVQWLIDNYETAEGVSLPRSTLYSHYLRHCQEQKMDPMNPASFGKLIRSVFLGLRTRRLGTRGNSKYHYYGIRIKATSPLNQYTDEQTMALRQQPISQGKSLGRFKGGGMVKSDGSEGHDGSNGPGSDGPPSQQHQHLQFLGDASAALPDLGTIEVPNSALPEGVTQEHVRAFENLYKEHCEAILDVVVNLQFSLIEALWQSFWRNSLAEMSDGDNDSEMLLPKDKLYTMCKCDAIQKFVRKSDYAFYQALVEVLIPDVLRPIPSSLTQAIRNFAKSLEGWLKGSLTGVPEEMVKTKVGAVSAFAQTLRRYTSLNHLAQAARAVLQNTSQINQMLADLNRVDFANVQEQASWVCQCDDGVVQQLEQDFKKTLQQQNTLDEWADWLDGVVKQVLQPHEGSPNFPKAARQFLLKWSFYSSMVIRDLTLRSAASFGSFHLIRLLYDEYMFYLVEQKVAAATGETPIAVMGEFIDLSGVMALGTLDSEPVKHSPMPPTPMKLSTVSMGIPANPGPITATHTLVAPAMATTNGGNLTNGTMATGAPIMNNTAAVLSNQMAAVQAGNQTTVAVLATGAQTQGTKTIVVVPVSSAGSGDAPRPAKIAKTS